MYVHLLEQKPVRLGSALPNKAVVTKPYKVIWFGDIHGPKPYKFVGFRWAFISQTPVESLPSRWSGHHCGCQSKALGPGYTPCYAIVLPGRKSAFRFGFGGTATGKEPKSALRPAFGRPESPSRCSPGSSPAEIRPGRPISGRSGTICGFQSKAPDPGYTRDPCTPRPGKRDPVRVYPGPGCTRGCTLAW